ncbi:MAG: hypothetical protein HKN42_18005 [Granulosicoccus sp.]|nr:hypothetical protein [Granulosicoccus sp.]
MNLPEWRPGHTSGNTPVTSPLTSVWQAERIALLWLLALAPAVGFAIWQEPAGWLRTAFLVALLLQAWQLLFRLMLPPAGALFSIQDLVHALLFALLLPVDFGIREIVFTVSFGSVFGDRLFGGRGFSFLNPVVTGMGFALFTFSSTSSDIPLSAVPIAALLIPAIVLTSVELISIRTLLGILASAVFLLAGSPGEAASWQLEQSSTLALVALYLVTDPAAGGSTDASRFAHGLLFGVLAMVLLHADQDVLAAAINAALLASLSAPLLDHLVVQMLAYRRGQRLLLQRRAVVDAVMAAGKEGRSPAAGPERDQADV